MKYLDFRKLLEKNQISGPYLFYGEEGLIGQEIILYIKNKYIDQDFLDFNYVTYRGADLDLDDFYSAIETLPFMSPYRLVLVSDIGSFYKDKKPSELFYQSLDNINKSTILIFEDMDGDLKKSTKLFKYFKKNNRDVDFSKLDSRQIRTFIRDYLKKRGKFMEDGDISYFLLLTGYENKRLEVSLFDVKSELDKVIAYGKEDRISKDIIDASVVKVNDSNIFNLLDSLQAENTKKALAYLHDLYDKDEPANLILHMVQRRYRHLYAYAAMKDDGVSPRDIRSSLGISDFEFRNIVTYGNKKTPCDFKAKLEDIYQTDKLLKSAPIDDLVLLEYLMVNLGK